MLRFIFLFLYVSLPAFAARADVVLNDEKTVTAYGDVRLRLESDFDSASATGASVKARSRARYRARAGIKLTPNDVLTFDARLRSGSDLSHQSPHVTFYDAQGNRRGDNDVNLDKWYAGAKKDGWWGWAGRNSFPFWSHDEIFWDSDATLVGAAGGLVQPLGDGYRLSLSGGYFMLPVGLQDFSGNLGAGETILRKELGGGLAVSLGAGLFHFQPDRGDRDGAFLLNGNGQREYLIGTLNALAEWQWRGVPLSAEIDWLHNYEDYAATDPNAFTALNRDERDGYVLSFQAGKLAKQGDWLAAYYYAHIETFAVNSSYAQDDWTRWGSGGETRSSNMKGHQFNLSYAVTDRMNMIGRLYKVEAITTQEESTRLRLDVNYKF